LEKVAETKRETHQQTQDQEDQAFAHRQNRKQIEEELSNSSHANNTVSLVLMIHVLKQLNTGTIDIATLPPPNTNKQHKNGRDFIQ
jgi:hypothetical protein